MIARTAYRLCRRHPDGIPRNAAMSGGVIGGAIAIPVRMRSVTMRRELSTCNEVDPSAISPDRVTGGPS